MSSGYQGFIFGIDRAASYGVRARRDRISTLALATQRPRVPCCLCATPQHREHETTGTLSGASQTMLHRVYSADTGPRSSHRMNPPSGFSVENWQYCYQA